MPHSPEALQYNISIARGYSAGTPLFSTLCISRRHAYASISVVNKSQEDYYSKDSDQAYKKLD